MRGSYDLNEPGPGPFMVSFALLCNHAETPRKALILTWQGEDPTWLLQNQEPLSNFTNDLILPKLSSLTRPY